MPTKYKKKTKNGVEYYRQRFTINGHEYDITAKTPALLEEKIDDIKYKERTGDTINSPNVTVATWAREWLETYKKPAVIEKSYKLYRTNINKHVLPHIGNLPLTDIRPIHLQKILLLQEGKSKTHIQHVKIAMTSMFKQARINKYIKDDPSTDLIMPPSVAECAKMRKSITRFKRQFGNLGVNLVKMAGVKGKTVY